jgi:hypothetical protein
MNALPMLLFLVVLSVAFTHALGTRARDRGRALNWRQPLDAAVITTVVMTVLMYSIGPSHAHVPDFVVLMAAPFIFIPAWLVAGLTFWRMRRKPLAPPAPSKSHGS